MSCFILFDIKLGYAFSKFFSIYILRQKIKPFLNTIMLRLRSVSDVVLHRMHLKHATLTHVKIKFVWLNLTVSLSCHRVSEYCFEIIMVCRKVSDNLRWQIIGMKNVGLSCREIGHQINWHRSVVARVVQKFGVTNDVKDRPHPGRPRKTRRCEDAVLLHLVRRHPFKNSTVLKTEWFQGREISTRTIRNQLKAAGYRARRPIRRQGTLTLTRNHRAARLQWSIQRQRWNLASWRRFYFSDESWILFHVVDGRLQTTWATLERHQDIWSQPHWLQNKEVIRSYQHQTT